VSSDEFVTIRKKKIEFGLERFIPLSKLMAYDPGFLKYEIEKAAEEFGYYTAKQEYHSAASPEVMISLRFVQRAMVEVELGTVARAMSQVTDD